jgi:Flp pilus assembly protein TadB
MYSQQVRPMNDTERARIEEMLTKDERSFGLRHDIGCALIWVTPPLLLTSIAILAYAHFFALTVFAVIILLGYFLITLALQRNAAQQKREGEEWREKYLSPTTERGIGRWERDCGAY